MLRFNHDKNKDKIYNKILKINDTINDLKNEFTDLKSSNKLTNDNIISLISINEKLLVHVNELKIKNDNLNNYIEALLREIYIMRRTNGNIVFDDSFLNEE